MQSFPAHLADARVLMIDLAPVSATEAKTRKRLGEAHRCAKRFTSPNLVCPMAYAHKKREILAIFKLLKLANTGSIP